MANYKRFYRNGGTWFFTVNLWQCQNNDLLIREINLLRQSVRNIRQKHPFTIHRLGRIAGAYALHLAIARRRQRFFPALAPDKKSV